MEAVQHVRPLERRRRAGTTLTRPPNRTSTPQFDPERLANRVAELVEQRSHGPVSEKLDQLTAGLDRVGAQIARLDRGQLHIIDDVKEAQMHITELRSLVGLTDESKTRLATEMTAEATGAAVSAALASAPLTTRPILDVDQLRDRFWNLKAFRNLIAAISGLVAFFKLVIPVATFLCHEASAGLISLIRKVLGPIVGGDA